MAHVGKSCPYAGADIHYLAVNSGLKLLKGVFYVLRGIQGLHKRLARTLVLAVLVFGVLLLYMGAVGQHNAAEL